MGKHKRSGKQRSRGPGTQTTQATKTAASHGANGGTDSSIGHGWNLRLIANESFLERAKAADAAFNRMLDSSTDNNAATGCQLNLTEGSKALSPLLAWFREGSDADPAAELIFPAHLQKKQRANIHGLTQDIGLGALETFSRGVGGQRYISVMRKGSAPKRELTEAQQHKAQHLWQWACQAGNFKVSKDEVADMVFLDLLPPELAQLWSEKAAQQKTVIALCRAVAAGDEDRLKALAASADGSEALRSGAFDVEEGCAPLHLAAANGSAEFVDLLLKAGAKLDAVDGNNNTALELARKLDKSDAEGVLLRAGAEDPTANHFPGGQASAPIDTALDSSAPTSHTAGSSDKAAAATPPATSAPTLNPAAPAFQPGSSTSGSQGAKQWLLNNATSQRRLPQQQQQQQQQQPPLTQAGGLSDSGSNAVSASARSAAAKSAARAHFMIPKVDGLTSLTAGHVNALPFTSTTKSRHSFAQDPPEPSKESNNLAADSEMLVNGKQTSDSACGISSDTSSASREKSSAKGQDQSSSSNKADKSDGEVVSSDAENSILPNLPTSRDSTHADVNVPCMHSVQSGGEIGQPGNAEGSKSPHDAESRLQVEGRPTSDIASSSSSGTSSHPAADTSNKKEQSNINAGRHVADSDEEDAAPAAKGGKQSDNDALQSDNDAAVSDKGALLSDSDRPVADNDAVKLHKDAKALSRRGSSSDEDATLSDGNKLQHVGSKPADKAPSDSDVASSGTETAQPGSYGGKHDVQSDELPEPHEGDHAKHQSSNEGTNGTQTHKPEGLLHNDDSDDVSASQAGNGRSSKLSDTIDAVSASFKVQTAQSDPEAAASAGEGPAVSEKLSDKLSDTLSDNQSDTATPAIDAPVVSDRELDDAAPTSKGSPVSDRSSDDAIPNGAQSATQPSFSFDDNQTQPDKQPADAASSLSDSDSGASDKDSSIGSEASSGLQSQSSLKLQPSSRPARELAGNVTQHPEEASGTQALPALHAPHGTVGLATAIEPTAPGQASLVQQAAADDTEAAEQLDSRQPHATSPLAEALAAVEGAHAEFSTRPGHAVPHPALETGHEPQQRRANSSRPSSEGGGKGATLAAASSDSDDCADSSAAHVASCGDPSIDHRQQQQQQLHQQQQQKQPRAEQSEHLDEATLPTAASSHGPGQASYDRHPDSGIRRARGSSFEFSARPSSDSVCSTGQLDASFIAAAPEARSSIADIERQSSSGDSCRGHGHRRSSSSSSSSWTQAESAASSLSLNDAWTEATAASAPSSQAKPARVQPAGMRFGPSLPPQLPKRQKGSGGRITGGGELKRRSSVTSAVADREQPKASLATQGYLRHPCQTVRHVLEADVGTTQRPREQASDTSIPDDLTPPTTWRQWVADNAWALCGVGGMAIACGACFVALAKHRRH